jgi:phage terminase small subunit
MGKVRTPAQILRRLNPEIHPDELAVYLDAKTLYAEASADISKNGAIAGHPKTGAPMMNPYLPIRDLAGKTLIRFHRDHPDFRSATSER